MDEPAGSSWIEEPFGPEITPEQQREELLTAIIEHCEPTVQAVRSGDTGTAILYIRMIKTYAKTLKKGLNNGKEKE
ncbi:MAG: hypothetical protein IJI75_03420 [Solobacterium sp.]|nr:hypothetical protein [Solobacterium sp.]